MPKINETQMVLTACATKPGTRRDCGDSVASLMHTNIARVTEYHLIPFFRLGLYKKLFYILKLSLSFFVFSAGFKYPTKINFEI